MLRLAILFFVVSLGAAFLGFGGIAGTFSSLAVIAFYVFVALFLIALLIGLVSGSGGGYGAGGGVVMVALVAALLGAGGYASYEHGFSAEALGRKVDQSAAAAAADAKSAIRTAQAETGALANKVSRDAKDATDRADDKRR
jgi:uncharacterized membrane protein YtjA (UPF0391 family)